MGAGPVAVAATGPGAGVPGVPPDSETSAWAWGSTHDGQIGDDAPIARTLPVPVRDATGTGRPGHITAIAASDGWAGDNATYVGGSVTLDADGTVRAWGSNLMGQLGRTPGATGTCGADAEPCLADPQPIRGRPGVVVITSGAHHGLVVAGAAAPSTLRSPAPSTVPLPGLPPTGGGGGTAPDTRLPFPLLVLDVAPLLALVGLARRRRGISREGGPR